MDADTLDLCKENIQPLRQGRKASRLGLALQAQNDTELQDKLLKEREEHELAIITYDGEDPLEPRYDYVQWLEQSYPKHGKESNLVPIIEDTIMLFKEDDRYKQDQRFVELILKYIETQENAIELYQMVYGQGLGTMCSILYKSWAEALDRNSDLKRADQIYQLGIANHAEPLEPLKSAHMQFQLSVGRRMMEGDLPSVEKQVSPETSERQRQVLGKLKKATTSRIAHGTAGKYPTLGFNNKIKKDNGIISVYQEEDNNPFFGGVASGSCKTQIFNSESSHKENTLKAQPWNQGFRKKSQPVLPSPSPAVPLTPNFKVCIDPEEEETTQSSSKTKPTLSTTKVLKTRKAEIQQLCPLMLFKSPHPGAKTNLPKFEVFAGGREFCFEEIRWAHYRKYNERMSLDDTSETPLKRMLQFTPCRPDTTQETPLTYISPLDNLNTIETP